MILRVLASGSKGNCYALCDGDSILLLDAGIPAGKVLAGIGHRARDVIACLVTHEHQDHAKAVERLDLLGIPCYGTKGTKGHVPQLRVCDKAIRLGPFMAMPFPVMHDAAEPCGWLVRNERTGEILLYATDTYAMRNTHPGVNYWLVECNYCEDLLNGTTDALEKRLQSSHMSMERLCRILRGNDLAACKKIVLCHISQTRGDYQRMIEAVKKATGKPVEVAIANTKIELELEPF